MPPPDQRADAPSFAHHVHHWSIKANYTFNVLRALTLCSDRGLRSSAILGIFDACVRSILLYGIEFWGSQPDHTQKADAFIYGAIRNLFDLPIAVPHRAISSEFACVPVHIRYRQIVRRIAARRLIRDPFKWLDSSLPPGLFRDNSRASLDTALQDCILPWDPPRLDSPSVKEFICCLDESGDVVCNELFKEGDLLVFTDGSFQDQKLGFSFVIFQDADCKFPLFEYNALLTPRKTILDAEATALVCGLDAALTLPHRGRIFLISDCRAALRLLQIGPAPGPLSYLMAPLKLMLDSKRDISALWIKGPSGHPGNELADSLAKNASLVNDPFPGSSRHNLCRNMCSVSLIAKTHVPKGFR